MGYLFQLIEGFTASTYRYLGNVDGVDKTSEIVNKMRMGRPIVKYHIQNYHYELRTRTVAHRVSDGRGGTRTEYTNETYWERVNTHFATEEYRYNNSFNGFHRYFEWADCSPDSSCIEYLK